MFWGLLSIVWEPSSLSAVTLTVIVWQVKPFGIFYRLKKLIDALRDYLTKNCFCLFFSVYYTPWMPLSTTPCPLYVYINITAWESFYSLVLVMIPLKNMFYFPPPPHLSTGILIRPKDGSIQKFNHPMYPMLYIWPTVTDSATRFLTGTYPSEYF